MSESGSRIELKLSPAASVGLVVCLLIAGGVVYLVKPEWIEQLTSQLGSTDVLSKSRYYPEIEENLKIYLRSAVINDLVARKASQAEFNAIRNVEIGDIRAEPLTYFRNELDFWQRRDLRRVDLLIRFRAGGRDYTAEGEMTVSGASNNITLSDVSLVKP
jgi:hypothetical protein